MTKSIVTQRLMKRMIQQRFIGFQSRSTKSASWLHYVLADLAIGETKYLLSSLRQRLL